MSSAKEIFEGWFNLILKDDKTESLSKYRLEICFNCPIRTGNKCDKEKGGCGCHLAAKTRSPSSKCPKGYW